MRRPRLGFLGVGWIGHHRMKSIIEANIADVIAIADPSAAAADEAKKSAPGAEQVETLGDLLALEPDGIVIATPTALHAEQAIRALEHGAAVFCQKPLGRTATEVLAVVKAARAMDRLLAVDLSYRFTEGIRRIRDLIRSGELGRIYAADLVFHNAYGPDKGWFYDPVLSGGGCVMDLGVHLVDLVLWMLDCTDIGGLNARLLTGGEPLGDNPDKVEDYAIANFELATGAVVQLACSWRLNAGREAVISAIFYGTEGGAALRNVNGSFYDFVAERYRGTTAQTLAAPPDAWFGRAAADWARRLAAGERFDPAIERAVDAARVLDRIYGRA
jgi:predicted dehydrogenase